MGKFPKPHLIEWFYLPGGLFLILHYTWFVDDAFVYFRYVDNLLFLDLGLVYNQGEYVEGYSSPLWFFLLSLVRATGASYWFTIRLIACVSFLGFWWMLLILQRKLSPQTTPVNFPLAYLAFNYGVLCYFTSGLETPFVQVIAIAYALYILNPFSKTLQILLAVSPLIRQELIIPLLLCLLWTWIYYKKVPWRASVLSFFCIGFWIAFKIYYYADLFPNTFYLKDVVDIQQGFFYLQDTVATYHFYFVAGAFLLLVLLLKILAPKQVNLEITKRLMMVLAALPVVLYVIKIGGEARHYRYFAFPFCLITCAFSGVLEHFIKIFHVSKSKLLAPLTGLAVSVTVFFFYPPQLDNHPFFFTEKHRRVNKINDAALHRQHPDLNYSSWGKEVTIESMLSYKESNPEFKYRGIKADFWCVGNYKNFNQRIIHSLGLTDAILARTEMKIDKPAHRWGLLPLAQDLVLIQESSEYIGRGMYRKAVEAGRAPKWIRKNLESIEVIERKIYNNHNLRENLKLAFTFPKRIEP